MSRTMLRLFAAGLLAAFLGATLTAADGAKPTYRAVRPLKVTSRSSDIDVIPLVSQQL